MRQCAHKGHSTEGQPQLLYLPLLTPPGHAPLTKVVFFSTVCCSLVMQVSQVTRGRIPFFVSLIAKAFVFHSPSDLVFGSVLLYHSRYALGDGGPHVIIIIFIALSSSSLHYAHTVPAPTTTILSLFERQMGSGKYGAFLLFTGAVSKLMEHVSMRVCGLAGRMGPFNAVFANMINYLIDIPAVQHFSLFGMPLNDKVCAGGGGGAHLMCVYIVF